MLEKVCGRVRGEWLEEVYRLEEASLRQLLDAHPTCFNSWDPRPGSFSATAGTDPGPYPSGHFCHSCS